MGQNVVARAASGRNWAPAFPAPGDRHRDLAVMPPTPAKDSGCRENLRFAVERSAKSLGNCQPERGERSGFEVWPMFLKKKKEILQGTLLSPKQCLQQCLSRYLQVLSHVSEDGVYRAHP